MIIQTYVPVCERHGDEPTDCPWCEVERLKGIIVNERDPSYIGSLAFQLKAALA